MGLLRVKGTIAVEQFWPKGKSDADTATILVGVNSKTAFQYQEKPGRPFKTTHAFEGTLLHGKQGPKPPIDDKGRIKVRLQGVDAAELHYRPSPLAKSLKATLSQKKLDAFRALNHEYRQHWGESAALALLNFLSQLKKPVIDCSVTSYVSEPTDVFDTYGRLIGDIWVRSGGQDKNVNLWLVREGWVYPSFYDSMKPSEINAVLAAWSSGKNKGRSASALSGTLGTLDLKLVYRSGKNLKVTSGADKGAVLYPKIFRRQVSWTAQKKAGIVSQGFNAFVAAGADKYKRLADYLAHQKNAPSFPLANGLGAGTFKLRPESTVFVEDANSQLKKDNKVVTNWF
jgi:endonuclease YncB( thermonuclease family)